MFAQNIPAFCELHFGIPMAGAVICALNSRLDAGMAFVLLQHSEAKVVLVDVALLGVAREALRFISQQAGGASRVPAVVLINEALDEPPPAATGNDKILGVDRCYEYEALSNSRGGDPEFLIRWSDDENEPIALDPRAGAVNRGEGRWICGRWVNRGGRWIRGRR